MKLLDQIGRDQHSTRAVLAKQEQTNKKVGVGNLCECCLALEPRTLATLAYLGSCNEPSYPSKMLWQRGTEAPMDTSPAGPPQRK